MTYTETLDMPFGELLSLIAIEQIKSEGAKAKKQYNDDEIIPDVP